MQEVNWNDLTLSQVKKLKLHSIDEVSKILDITLRDQQVNDFDFFAQEIYTAWSRIVIAAQKELGVKIIGPDPKDVVEIRKAIINLISKSFPYNDNNSSNNSELS